MLYELLSQVFGGHVITNEWWGHTNSGQALAQPARPGFFFFFFLSLCEKKQGEKKNQKKTSPELFLREFSQPLPSSVVTRSVCTHPHGSLGTEFSVLGFLLESRSGQCFHVEFAGVDLEDFVLLLLLSLPVPGLVHKIRSSDFRRSAAPRNNLECACSGWGLL